MPKPGYKMLAKSCALGQRDAERAVTRALRALRAARADLKAAGCPLTLDRVRLAISSAKGALRNVQHRPFHEERRRQRERRCAVERLGRKPSVCPNCGPAFAVHECQTGDPNCVHCDKCGAMVQ